MFFILSPQCFDRYHGSILRRGARMKAGQRQFLWIGLLLVVCFFGLSGCDNEIYGMVHYSKQAIQTDPISEPVLLLPFGVKRGTRALR